ncbi:hypothetical protein Y032_0007g3541 [Ancylostoma ceylanicum]|uniref:tRNA (guanine(37)-N1)-methyltransferase n=1 Tax=Ancylostoma ceylanicum TaxID=53326 RepID=A0A016VPQ3_9BILA|nr:hypothetical protein Y032_0007g3541 [Ancylostoma ceylanicum]
MIKTFLKTTSFAVLRFPSPKKFAFGSNKVTCYLTPIFPKLQALLTPVYRSGQVLRMSSELAADQNHNGVGESIGDSALEIPEVVRGMTDLRKDLFQTNVTLCALRVESSKISIIQRKVRLEKYLFKNLGRIKSISNAEDPKQKLLLFDPNLVKEDSAELKGQIEAMIREHAGDTDLQWELRTIPIAFEDWDLRRILRAVLPKELDFSSYSQAGHIVHVNLRENLLPFKKVIGQILLEKVGKCRTVVNKIDGITNEFRNFELDLLAGEDNYVTEVIEGGVRYKLDFSKVFWNSRLSHEHERVVKMFDSRSLVYDACAGVGPFVLPALKKGRINRVLANDLNPESVKWLKDNASLNKISPDRIDIHNLDAADFIRGPVADDLYKKVTCTEAEQDHPSGAYVMMNLPAYAVNFLPAFRCMMARHNCSEIAPQFPIKAFCYLFAKAHEDVPDKWYERRAKEMVREFVKENEASIDLIHHVRTVSSRKEMFCVQLNLSWNFLIGRDADGVQKRSCEDTDSDLVDSKRKKLD